MSAQPQNIWASFGKYEQNDTSCFSPGAGKDAGMETGQNFLTGGKQKKEK